jgi:hypothetical protein
MLPHFTLSTALLLSDELPSRDKLVSGSIPFTNRHHLLWWNSRYKQLACFSRDSKVFLCVKRPLHAASEPKKICKNNNNETKLLSQ